MKVGRREAVNFFFRNHQLTASRLPTFMFKFSEFTEWTSPHNHGK
jgi:hypothetical protein